MGNVMRNSVPVPDYAPNADEAAYVTPAHNGSTVAFKICGEEDFHEKDGKTGAERYAQYVREALSYRGDIDIPVASKDDADTVVEHRLLYVCGMWNVEAPRVHVRGAPPAGGWPPILVTFRKQWAKNWSPWNVVAGGEVKDGDDSEPARATPGHPLVSGRAREWTYRLQLDATGVANIPNRAMFVAYRDCLTRLYVSARVDGDVALTGVTLALQSEFAWGVRRTAADIEASVQSVARSVEKETAGNMDRITVLAPKLDGGVCVARVGGSGDGGCGAGGDADDDDV